MAMRRGGERQTEKTHIWVGDGILSLDRVGLERERHCQPTKWPALVTHRHHSPQDKGFLGSGTFL